MEQINSIIFTATITLMSGEILYYITPKNKINEYIYALLYTVLIISAILSFDTDSLQFTFNEQSKYQEEIDEFINEMYLLSGEEELAKVIQEALAIVNIECTSVDAILSINENDEILIEEMEVKIKYIYDVPRAKIIIDEIFKGLIPFEVSGEL